MRGSIVLVIICSLTLAAPVAGHAQENAERIGDVYYRVEQDRMNDETHRFVIAQDEAETVRVIWRCSPNDPTANFGTIVEMLDRNLAMRMAAGGTGSATGGSAPFFQYRVDDREPVRSSRFFTTAGSSPSIGSFGDIARTFAEDAMSGSSLLVRVWNGDGERVATVEMPVDGLSQALAKLPCFVQQE